MLRRPGMPSFGRLLMNATMASWIAEAGVDVAQLRGEVGAFTQQRVATDTVVLLPYPLPLRHLFGERLVVIAIRRLTGGIEGQGEKQKRRKNTLPP